MSDTRKNFAPKKALETPAQKTAAPSFTVKESRLIAAIGASRDTLRALRAQHLKQGVDWQQCGRSVMLTPEAVDKIAEAAKLQPAEVKDRPMLLLGFPGFTPPAVVTLKAWRFHPVLRNRHIVEAYFPHTDPKNRRNIVRVRVTDSANFVPHMELPARFIQAPDLYECTRPAPRAKGRW